MMRFLWGSLMVYETPSGLLWGSFRAFWGLIQNLRGLSWGFLKAPWWLIELLWGSLMAPSRLLKGFFDLWGSFSSLRASLRLLERSFVLVTPLGLPCGLLWDSERPPLKLLDGSFKTLCEILRPQRLFDSSLRASLKLLENSFVLVTP